MEANEIKKTWNLVLVGCGGISGTWFDVIRQMPELRLVGLVDLDLNQARKRADEYGLGSIAVHTELDALLGQVEAEVVFDCTVPPAHKNIVLTALKHGCHVFGEKPLADTMEHAREMVAAADKAGKSYGVMQNRRWLQPIRQVRQALDQGLIGKVHTLHADFFLGCHFGGFRDEMEHVLLADMAIHSFDQARFLIDARPLSVVAHEWNPPGSWYAHGASAMAVFDLEDEGVFSYRGSWSAEGFPTSWECAWRIIGETGTLLWDGGDGIRIECVAEKEGFTRKCEPVTPPPCELPKDQLGHAGAIRNFITCLETGEVPETPGQDNIHSLSMVHGAIASAIHGTRVVLDTL